MAEYNVMTTIRIPKAKRGDKIYTYEGYGVKKIGLRTDGGRCIINGLLITSSLDVIEFPQLGKSLPCLFTIEHSSDAEGNILCVIVMEYGGQPDPKYFDIIGLDETGEPIYQEKEVTT